MSSLQKQATVLCIVMGTMAAELRVSSMHPLQPNMASISVSLISRHVATLKAIILHLGMYNDYSSHLEKEDISTVLNELMR